MLVYCHTFSGNRTEGKELIPYLINDMSVLLFDFIGCGNSGGEYLTLGVNEAIDLKEIIKHIKEAFKVRSVYLWGRSMGSATIMNYLFNIRLSILLYHENNNIKNELIVEVDDDPSKKKKLQPKIDQLTKTNKELRANIMQKELVKAVVIDSSFVSAEKMVKDLMKKRMKTSGLLTSLAFMYLKNSVKSHTKVDVLGKNNPGKLARFLHTPAVFMVGDQDDLVDMGDFKQMFDEYNAEDKRFRVLTNTNHSDARSEEDVEFVVNFIKFIEEKNRPTEKDIYQFKS